MEPNTEVLLERASSGDPVAVDTLLERHLQSLRSYVRLRSGPALRARESCTDLVQSVCREVLQDSGEFEYRGEAAFRQWLFQAAERKLADRARYWGRAKREIGREVALGNGGRGSSGGVLGCYVTFCTPSQEAVAQEQIDRIEATFDQLPQAYREVILLRRVVGLETPEVAAQMGQSAHYVRTLLSRALSRLATLLDEGRPGR